MAPGQQDLGVALATVLIASGELSNFAGEFQTMIKSSL